MDNGQIYTRYNYFTKLLSQFTRGFWKNDPNELEKRYTVRSNEFEGGGV